MFSEIALGQTIHHPKSIIRAMPLLRRDSPFNRLYFGSPVMMAASCGPQGGTTSQVIPDNAQMAALNLSRQARSAGIGIIRSHPLEKKTHFIQCAQPTDRAIYGRALSLDLDPLPLNCLDAGGDTSS
jgi:hypothetical protein